MSAAEDAIAKAIEDARVLLGTLRAGGWQDIHVVSGETEIFIAQASGGSNPMRKQVVAAGPERLVSAPHVGTLVDVVAAGAIVEAGQPLARISVLDTEDIITAPEAGFVVAVHASIGVLLEYNIPILTFVKAV